jgi:hypothetical protein
MLIDENMELKQRMRKNEDTLLKVIENVLPNIYDKD